MATKLDEFFYELGYRIGPDAQAQVARYLQGLKKTGRASTNASKDFDRMTRSTERSSRALGTLRKRVTAVLAAIGGFFIVKRLAAAFIDAADSSEQYKLRLTALLRSQEEANRLFKEAAQYAARVPFEYRDIMEAATTLAGIVKGGADEVMGYLPLIGDLAAVTGLTFIETTEQIQRMVSAGAAAADRFRERGVLAMLGFQAGVSYTAEETRRRLFEAWRAADSQFKGAADSLGRTWKGLMSMFADRWYTFRNLVAEKGLFDTLKTAADEMLAKLDELGETGALDKLAQKISDAGRKGVEAIGKVVEATGRAIRAISEHPKTAELGLIGYIFLGKKGAALLAGIGFLGERVGRRLGEMVAGPSSELRALEERVEKLYDEVESYDDLLQGLEQSYSRVIAKQGEESRRAREIKDWIDKTREARDLANSRLQVAINALGRYGEATREAEENERAFTAAMIEAGQILQSLAEDTDRETKETKKPTPTEPGPASVVLTKEQVDLQEELAERVRKIVLSSAEQQVAAVQALRETYRKEFGEISAEAERQFAIVEAAAAQALRKEKATALADGYRAAIEAGLAKIDFDAIGIADEEERQRFILSQQQQLLATLFSVAQQRLVVAENTTEEEEALRDVLAEIVRLIRQASREHAEIGKSADERLRDLQATLYLIRQSVDGALDLARAFGIVNDEMANTIRSLEQIAEGIAVMATSIASGNVAGIISGGIGLLGGLANLFGGGGPSPYQLAVQENTKAMYLLADRMNELAVRLSDEMDQLAGALELLRREEVITKFGGRARFQGVRLSPEEFREVWRAAQGVGLTIPEEYLERAARGEYVEIYGTLLDQLREVLEGVVGERGAVGAAGRTQQVLRSVAITELQANRLLAYQATLVVSAEERNQLLSRIYGALTGRGMPAPAVTGLSPVGGTSVGPITIENITVGAGATTQQAAEVSHALADELSRELGERLKGQQRLLGAGR